MKTANLTGAALDYAVAQCEGKKLGWKEQLVYCSDLDLSDSSSTPGILIFNYSPSTNWAQGGPIIEREIDVLRKRSKAEEASLAYPNPNFKFKAEKFSDTSAYFCGFGPTPLIAAMRCYVASKLGDEVEIPECLNS